MFDKKYTDQRITNSLLKELGFERRATMGVIIYYHRKKDIEVNSMESIMQFDSFARVWYDNKECQTIGSLNDAIADKKYKDRIREIKNRTKFKNTEND